MSDSTTPHVNCTGYDSDDLDWPAGLGPDGREFDDIDGRVTLRLTPRYRSFAKVVLRSARSTAIAHVQNHHESLVEPHETPDAYDRLNKTLSQATGETVTLTAEEVRTLQDALFSWRCDVMDRAVPEKYAPRYHYVTNATMKAEKALLRKVRGTLP